MATMLWSLVQAMVMKMRASILTEKKTISGVKYWVLKENYLYSREKCVAAIDIDTIIFLVTIKLYRNLYWE